MAEQAYGYMETSCNRQINILFTWAAAAYYLIMELDQATIFLKSGNYAHPR